MHTAFCIADGRTCFYQWDVNQQMLVADETIKELHFCNGTSECSLVCKVEDGKADVPNILLQSARSISVYGYTGEHTKIQKIFRVNPRTKPEDYVYTETEVKRYEALEKRVDALEKVEPPAPYVLPTASAEVKGGVQVGNGLRMDGDVLRLNGFETLLYVKTNEEVSEIGTPTDQDIYDEYVLYAIVPPAANAHTVTVKYQNGLATNLALSTSADTTYVFTAKKFPGYKWMNVFGAASMYYQQAKNYWFYKLYLEKSTVSINTNGTFPVGTEVVIFGRKSA